MATAISRNETKNSLQFKNLAILAKALMVSEADLITTTQEIVNIKR